MTNLHGDPLVKMANQIALNMAAEGEAASRKAAEHIIKFWTPAMRQQLLDLGETRGGELPHRVAEVIEILVES